MVELAQGSQVSCKGRIIKRLNAGVCVTFGKGPGGRGRRRHLRLFALNKRVQDVRQVRRQHVADQRSARRINYAQDATGEKSTASSEEGREQAMTDIWSAGDLSQMA